jgi:hypothetical protein
VLLSLFALFVQQPDYVNLPGLRYQGMVRPLLKQLLVFQGGGLTLEQVEEVGLERLVAMPGRFGEPIPKVVWYIANL